MCVHAILFAIFGCCVFIPLSHPIRLPSHLLPLSLPVSPYIDAHSYFMRWFHANKHTHTQSKTPQTFCQNDWSIYVVGIVAAGNRENVESNGGQQKQNHSKFNMHAECLYENVQNACKCGFAWVSPCTLLPSLHPPFIFLFFERKRRKRPKHFVFIANCAFINW